MNFAGEFECHLTVSDRVDPSALRQWATNSGLKCLNIQLDRGSHPIQPMLTFTAMGELAAVCARAQALEVEMASAAFPVWRMKIEAACTNHGVPWSDSEATTLPVSLYFEHHVKILITSVTDLGLLRELAERHNAHLSKNNFRAHADGTEERFVTQRCFLVGRCSAATRLEKLVSALHDRFFSILKIEEEYVVYDSNLDLDKDWIHYTS